MYKFIISLRLFVLRTLQGKDEVKFQGLKPSEQQTGYDHVPATTRVLPNSTCSFQYLPLCKIRENQAVSQFHEYWSKKCRRVIHTGFLRHID